MAIKSTIFKAQLQIADMDRGVYADHALTLARHPSETDERLLMRILAFALNVPATDEHGRLEAAKGISDTDEPDFWQHDLSGQLLHWVEVGQPDDRRMIKAAGRADRVTVIAYAASTPIWWAGLQNKVARAPRLAVWQVPAEQSQALAALAQRTMQLQFTVQDGTVWVGDGQQSVEVTPQVLKAAA
ncbi:YaeQ family protein [Aquincola sp. MAHUQ-54]|uniref:YaeQ family protein n=1 Tax=Aquincola agrisoli TaxID=3119538 RepID=A0AAW9QBG7_9BURK